MLAILELDFFWERPKRPVFKKSQKVHYFLFEFLKQILNSKICSIKIFCLIPYVMYCFSQSSGQVAIFYQKDAGSRIANAPRPF